MSGKYWIIHVQVDNYDGNYSVICWIAILRERPIQFFYDKNIFENHYLSGVE